MDYNAEPRPTATDMLQAVMDHATTNYSTGGWDIVVETMSNMDIIDVIWGAKSIKGAIWKMSRHIAPIASYRRDVQGA